MAHVPDVESVECPVSAVTAESRALVTLAETAQRTKEATGAAFPTADAGHWPAWYSDLIETVEAQRRAIKSAVDETLSRP
jgi:hypothetical protein